jgi:hypothetical protein
MYKKILVSIVLLLGLVGPSALANIPIPPILGPTFDNAVDIGIPARGAIGGTIYVGQEMYAGQLLDKYFMLAGGADIWGTADQFHYAYKAVTGDVRLSIGYKPQNWDNDWVKLAPMFRDGLAANAIMVYNAVRRGPWDATNLRWSQDRTAFQGRLATGAGAVSIGSEYLKPAGVEKPVFLGVQRVTYRGLPFIEGLVDWGTGAGWERSGSLLLANPILNQPGLILPVLPDQVNLGVAMTSHRLDGAAESWVYGPKYEQNPSFVGPAPVLVDNPIPECPTPIPGFKIRTIRVGMGLAWPSTNAGDGYNAMNQLLNPPGEYPTGIPGEDEETRIDQVVNLYDSSGRGEFDIADGYPDVTFPGIDAFISNPTDPADADDDNNFATEILACIQLTPGLHIIGVNSDDGAIVKIGGIEIGRTGERTGASNVDCVFEVGTGGSYPLQVRHLEGGGGSELELHEIIQIGGVWTRILLGAMDSQGRFLGSPVYVPEPATMALLGLGALALLRRKK